VCFVIINWIQKKHFKSTSGECIRWWLCPTRKFTFASDLGSQDQSRFSVQQIVLLIIGVRKHANKEIDSKGRPMKSRPASAGKASNKQSTPCQGRSKSGSGSNADIVCDVCGQVSMARTIK
jgi:hypothetical protein